MARTTLRKRIDELELQISRLQDEVRAAKRERAKDWRRTMGAFTDDEGMQEILREAMRLREADRKKARSRVPAGGKRSR
jgi:predicted  nucleic acid-binding Zn-ribbon protein